MVTCLELHATGLAMLPEVVLSSNPNSEKIFTSTDNHLSYSVFKYYLDINFVF